MTRKEQIAAYNEALDAEMKRIGYDTFRRTDEKGIEYVCFLLPVNDNGDVVLTELCVFSASDYCYGMQFYSTIAGKFENRLPELETAIARWNLDCFGTYGIYYSGMNLYHRQINVMDAEETPEKAARLALYTIAIIRGEINGRIEAVRECIGGGNKIDSAGLQ